SKSNPGLGFLNRFRGPIKQKIEDLKLARLNIEKEAIDNLRASVSIANFNVSDTGEAKESSSDIASLAGYIMAFLMYFFVFVYGSFIMQSVLNEKTSKIVEVIVSSVKPFQLMIGKVLANAAVALTQFAIWVVLISSFTFLLSSAFNYNPRAAQQQMIEEQLAQADIATDDVPPELVTNILDVFAALPVAQIVVLFVLYFLGGFLLYGALFAAVGSAVDSLQEAQQFMLPVSLPIILSLLLMSVALQNPNGATSVSLSIIPFTSPIIMLARIPFEVPAWQIVLSLICLVGGFLFTIWFAGRIYRVGILTSGSKVTYKVLAKWFMMKNY
ncbi:MAG: ABC transporter permease, partial [Bacteroidota bacterium]